LVSSIKNFQLRLFAHLSLSLFYFFIEKNLFGSFYETRVQRLDRNIMAFLEIGLYLLQRVWTRSCQVQRKVSNTTS